MKLAAILLCQLLCLGTTVHAQDASVTLHPAAEVDHVSAMAAYTRGDYAAALAGFKQAYARMGDPLADRQGRDFVLGSLRSTWARLYEVTHDRVQLCDWRAALQTHTTALRQALGAAATPADTAGLERLLVEVDAQLVRDFPGDPRCDAPVPVSAAVEPVVTPATLTTVPPKEIGERTRDPRLAGKVVLGIGVASLLGTTAALIVAADRRSGIVALDESLLTSGRPASAAEVELVDTLHRQGRGASIAAAVTGAVGGIAVIAAVALLASGRKSPRKVQVGPQAGIWGLSVHGQF